MEQPLYCFKLNIEDGSIKKITIPPEKLTERKDYNRKFWRLYMNSAFYYCYEKDLDQLKNWKVYSFNSDIEHARDIMMNALSVKFNKAYRDAKLYGELMPKLLNGDSDENSNVTEHKNLQSEAI